MNQAEQSILKILAYYNLFNHPLKREEILRFLDTAYAVNVMDTAFNTLLESGTVFRIQGFYLLQNSPTLVARRLKGNAQARRRIGLAAKIAWFLSQFPYIKGVAFSGLLSKNYADSSSAIDFFIITDKNRLWIARSILHLFKKLNFLVRCQHWFCMNYYIDDEALEIQERNIYTAMEIATLLPFYDDGVFNRFFDSNKWVSTFFPCFIHQVSISPAKRSLIKEVATAVLDRLPPDKTEQWLMRFTLRRWQKKAMDQTKSHNDTLLKMDGSAHDVKPNPGHFQEKLLRQYEKSAASVIEQFARQHQSTGSTFLHREIM